MTAVGAVTTWAGASGGGYADGTGATNVRFVSPRGIVLDSSGTSFYVTSSNYVRKIAINTGKLDDVSLLLMYMC
jgi:hypothetical protein